MHLYLFESSGGGAVLTTTIFFRVLLGEDSGLKGLEDLDLDLGSKLLLLGGGRVGKTLGLGQVVADGLFFFQLVCK